MYSSNSKEVLPFPYALRQAAVACASAFQHGLFGHSLQVGPLLDRLVFEPLAKIAPQPVLVRQEPRLHELHHQERLIFARLVRLVPTVLLSSPQVLPRANVRG